MKRAVALRYDGFGEPIVSIDELHEGGEGDDAPVVVCSGEGDLAAHIEREAIRSGVPVVRDVPLCHALAELRAGEPIPEGLYEAVAAILREIAAGGAEGLP
jgi:type III secretion system FlhB-like substrate exporter